ncbi:MAG: CDP-alcohol phosphatidyltransferase family protein [Bacteroidetes bacterium]|nr:CDP-alcohol phosphatidyltransferase family protein [Bacteroidota bacterium]
MNIPNLISSIRIILAPFLWYLVYADNKIVFTWLITVAFFTDLIDGFIARSTHQVSKLGSKLDSLGDSLTILSGFVGLAAFNFDLILEHIFIIVFVIALHIIQLLLSLWRYGKPSSFHTLAAKSGH